MKDYTGMIFGRLTAISYAGKRDNYRCWNMKCSCGKEIIAPINYCVVGDKKSCGCLLQDFNKDGENNLVHGDSRKGVKRKRLYTTWANMKYRCNNKNSDFYYCYGERGIKVCDEWANSYVLFKKWALENSYNDSLSIERKDVNGNYSPDNCCFIPVNNQAFNKRSTRYVIFNGARISLAALAKQIKMPYCVLKSRIKLEWDIARATTESINKRRGINREFKNHT